MAKIFTLILLLIGVESKINSQYWSSPGGGIGNFQTWGGVYKMIEHNGHLYAGGSFDMAGGSPANNIAKWDGNNWSSLGNGINGSVMALAVYNGELYAGGEFTFAGSTTAYNIAKWNGVNWTTVGTGIGSAQQWGVVSALAVYNGELYAGGFFTIAGGQNAKSIAKWNGTTWSAVGPGLTYFSTTSYVGEMAVYNGELIVGGGFTDAGTLALSNIAKWNGNSWAALGNGVNGSVYAIGIHNNDLFIGGEFHLPGNLSVTNIARWSGSDWSNVGNSLNNSVYSIHSHNGNLYAGGIFSGAGNYIAKWNNTNWSAVSGGMDETVMCMKTYNNELYAGGYFLLAGTTSLFRIARLSDTCLSAPQQPGPILTDMSCGNTGFYYVMPVTDATNYTWTLPAGWSGSSTSIGISTTMGVTGGLISVTANNSCGSSPASTLQLNGPPQVVISGDDSVCQNSVQTYSVAAVPGASDYWWTFPNGWAWSGSNPTINVNVGTNSGVITVTVYDFCGGQLGSAQLVVHVTTLPPQPGVITGNDTACNGSTQIYSINSVPNAVNYTWTLPNGWSGSSNGNNIFATVGNASGRISVKANNACGSGLASSIDIVVDHPLVSIDSIQGDTVICQLSTRQYSINPIAGAAGYTWQIPGGWSGMSASNSITTVANNFSGTMQVTAYNSCGSISSPVLEIQVEEPITDFWVLNGTYNACVGRNQNFEIENNPFAHYYTWTLPPGWTGSSNSPLIQTVVGTTGGIVSVRAHNSCGASQPVEWPVSVDLAVPAQPSNIQGLEFVETEQSAIYKIDAVPDARTYAWTINSGGNMGPGLNGTSVPVYWHTPGEHRISVQAINGCGASVVQSFIVKVALKGGNDPANPFDITAAPNPSNGVFNILTKRAQDKFMSIEVLNLAGQKIYTSGRITIASNYFSYPLNMEKMMSGVYIVRVMIDKKIYTTKVVKTN